MCPGLQNPEPRAQDLSPSKPKEKPSAFSFLSYIKAILISVLPTSHPGLHHSPWGKTHRSFKCFQFSSAVSSPGSLYGICWPQIPMTKPPGGVSISEETLHRNPNQPGGG